MCNDTSSTTAADPYRLVRFRNSTDATRALPFNTPLVAALVIVADAFRSGAGERRLALFHEGLAAFFIIVAGEAFRHQIGAALQVALALRLDRLADDIFDRIDRQRGVATDRVGIALHVFLELSLRQDAVDQTHHLRFGGGELARGVEDFLREGRADHVDQLLDALIAIAETELGGGYAELRIVRADAQIAAQRETDAAPDAIAADHGDGRLGEVEHRGVSPIDRDVIAIDFLLAGALALELGDVRA